MNDTKDCISRQALAKYLADVFRADVEVLELRPLETKVSAVDDPKGLGYGLPFEVDCIVDGDVRAFVVSRTRPAQDFGHDYPADRAWQALWAHDAYNTFPRHVRSIDVGFARSSGELVSAADATEFFQLVEKADGAPYWLDLERLLTKPVEPGDVARAETLARFLAAGHSVRRDDPALYHRRIRELVGHGECLMGILDSYPHPYSPLPADICEEIERNAVTWRWRLRGLTHRLVRTHGDFHPWNLLFRTGTDFSVLDRSRGDWGEPADDVAALAINYLFYGLRSLERGDRSQDAGPFPYLLRTFLETYLRTSGDTELCDVMPPFLAFRALVIAHPRWYGNLSPRIRRTLIMFARVMMKDTRFDPADVDRLLGASR